MNRKRAFLAVALAAGVVALALAIVWRPAPPAPVRPATGYKVVLVAVDGLDGYLVTQFAEKGTLPAISRFLRRATTAQVTADEPPLPLVGWTRLATGRPLSDAQMEAVGAPGGGRLFSLSPDVALAVRKAGGRTVVVGWPGTWPVTGDDGVVVAPYIPAGQSHASALAPVIFAEAPGQTAPELAPLVREAVSRSRRSLESEFGRLIGHDVPRPDPAWSEALAAARWALLADMTTVEVAAKLIARDEPDLSLVYLGGLDAVSHRFLPAAMPTYFAALPPGSESYAEVLEDYYRFVDSSLERLQRLCGGSAFIVVCSAYGTHPSPAGAPPSASHGEGAPGALILHGRDASSTPVPLQMSTVDVAPTILALLGVPVPSDMEGRIVTEALPDGLVETFPPTYARPPRRKAARESVERELEAEMDALVAGRLREL
jgi:hypothetical protein